MPKKYNKKKDDEVFWKYIFPFLLALAGIITYLAVPYINVFGLMLSKGWLGLIMLGGIAILLILYFTLLLRFRGKGLVYAIAIILFTMMCIWLLANHQMVFDWMDAKLGTWGTTGILLVFCLGVGLFIYLFL